MAEPVTAGSGHGGGSVGVDGRRDGIKRSAAGTVTPPWGQSAIQIRLVGTAWQTLAALRQLAPGIPVILASGYDEASVMAGDYSEQPQAFINLAESCASGRQEDALGLGKLDEAVVEGTGGVGLAGAGGHLDQGPGFGGSQGKVQVADGVDLDAPQSGGVQFGHVAESPTTFIDSRGTHFAFACNAEGHSTMTMGEGPRAVIGLRQQGEAE